MDHDCDRFRFARVPRVQMGEAGGPLGLAMGARVHGLLVLWLARIRNDAERPADGERVCAQVSG
ncbi:hypothetical protein D3C86_1924390 [compost metagenome]